MFLKISLFLCLLLSCTACQKSDSPGNSTPIPSKEIQPPAVAPPLPLTASPFLTQSLTTTTIETANEALPIWRRYAKNRPALIIVANAPAMLPVPPELRAEIDRLLKSGSDKELTWRSSPVNSDPLLLPAMTLNAVIDLGWFSEIIWIFPTKQPPGELNLATFQQQLASAQIASPEEAAKFVFKNGYFSGVIHGLPFTAAPAEALPPLQQSALLHIDIDYFRPLYKGEIKTPLYPLMSSLLEKIREQKWMIAAATVALSNQQFDGLPLQTRFLGKDLATILKEPQILQGDFPLQWERRSKALYLENFMQKDEILRIYLEMEKAAPSDPEVKFGLYGIFRQLNKGEEALHYLKGAVQLDPAYAQEYLTLAEIAREKKLPPKFAEMLQLAHSALPDNPFILTQLAGAWLNIEEKEKARALKEELAALHWSKIYYPDQAAESAALLKLLEGT